MTTFKDVQADRSTQNKLQAVLVAMSTSEVLRAKDLGFKKKRSERNVPHIVIKTKDRVYSVCWFWQRKMYRVFFPYPSNDLPQHRYDFHTPEAVRDFFIEQATREE